MSSHPFKIEIDLACMFCNYNLRTLSWSGACPECGGDVAETLREAQRNVPGFADRLRRTSFDPIAIGIGCAVDGILFVQNALRHAQRKAMGDTDTPNHVDARAICRGIRDHALGYFNDIPEALDLLNEWGVRSSEDVGRIVFGLVRAGVLAAREGDHESDFDALFTLKDLFTTSIIG